MNSSSRFLYIRCPDILTIICSKSITTYNVRWLTSEKVLWGRNLKHA